MNQFAFQPAGSMDSQLVPYIMTSAWSSLPDRARQTLQDLHHFRPFHRVNIPMPPMPFKESSSVFIPSKVTTQLITNRMIQEQFVSPKRLFQFLNWTLRINKSTQNMVVMEGQNARKVLLFDIELHDPRGHNLYALCTPNITQTPNAQPWRLVALVTADTITKWMEIDSRVLPRGVRTVSPHFEQYRNIKGNLKGIEREILEIDSKQNVTRYYNLRCIRAKHSKEYEEKVLRVRVSVFYEIVQSALKNENVSLIPIVSIVSRKTMDSDTNLLDFSVDYLLPVQVKGNWVGVVYRDGQCIMTLMDRYDITNKAIQCDPSFDIQSMDWFKNEFNRLEILPDSPRKMRNSKNRKSNSKLTTLSVDTQSSGTSSQCSTPRSSRSSSPSRSMVSMSELMTNSVYTFPPVAPVMSHYSILSGNNQVASPQPVQRQMPYPQAPILQTPTAVTQQWIQWTNQTIETAMAEANYFMKFHRQCIGR